jgi:hypothetical protein
MEFKGTIDKWFLRENLSTISTESGCLIARVFDGKGFALLEHKEQSEEIVKHNALLISKAPEMLEMLKHLIDDEQLFSESLINEVKQLIKGATEF